MYVVYNWCKKYTQKAKVSPDLTFNSVLAWQTDEEVKCRPEQQPWKLIGNTFDKSQVFTIEFSQRFFQKRKVFLHLWISAKYKKLQWVTVLSVSLYCKGLKITSHTYAKCVSIMYALHTTQSRRKCSSRGNSSSENTARSSQMDAVCQKQVRWLLWGQKNYQHSKGYQKLWYATAGVPDSQGRLGHYSQGIQLRSLPLLLN